MRTRSFYGWKKYDQKLANRAARLNRAKQLKENEKKVQVASLSR